MAKTRRPARKPPRTTAPPHVQLGATARQVIRRAHEARDRVAVRAQALRELVTGRAEEARARTTRTVSWIERAFELRVSRAVTRFGIPSRREVRGLARQVAELQANVDQLRRARARAS